MQKPKWVENLKNAHGANTQHHQQVWRVTWGKECDCVEVELGQFEGGLWFCGSSAGDTATEALAREFIRCAKAMLDAADDIIISDNPHPHARNAMDGARIMDWYIEARRAELKEGK